MYAEGSCLKLQGFKDNMGKSIATRGQMATRGLQQGGRGNSSRTRHSTSIQSSIPHFDVSLNINDIELQADQLSPYINVVKSQESLDQQKALTKKLNATNRTQQCVAYQHDNGGGLVIECQAGLYELLRHVMLHYFMNDKVAGRHQVIEVQSDNYSNIVETKYRIIYSGGNVQTYIIHMYHITSSLLVQGRWSSKQFIDKDWPIINQYIITANQKLNIRVCLHAQEGYQACNM